MKDLGRFRAALVQLEAAGLIVVHDVRVEGENLHMVVETTARFEQLHADALALFRGRVPAFAVPSVALIHVLRSLPASLPDEEEAFRALGMIVEQACRERFGLGPVSLEEALAWLPSAGR
jgi:hypothetical protein